MSSALRSSHKLDPEDRFGIKAVFLRKTKRRVDLDNLLKMVGDSGIGVIYPDDSQVVELSAKLILGVAEPRVVMVVYKIEEML
jgi:Holliday junction resolvase RusA-like endonuclease